MADVKVPIKFEIYKGDKLVREEVLNQDVIKVGKLASSHLRIDDETVSRMHAVIEVTGPDDVHIIDLGSTRGTLVNGERITKARLQSGDEIMFGDSRVLVTFLEAATPAQATPAPAGRARRRRRPRRLRAAPAGLRAPASSLRAAAAAAVRAAAAAGSAPPATQGSRPTRRRPPRRSRGRSGAGAEVEVHDGTRAMEVQTIYRGVVTGTRHLFNPEGKSTHGQGTSMLYAGLAAGAARAGHRSSPRRSTSARRRSTTRPGKRPARTRRTSSGRSSPGRDGRLVFGGFVAGLAPALHGPQAPRQDQPELHHRLGRRRRRPGLAGLRPVVVAPAGRGDGRATTSSTSPRA